MKRNPYYSHYRGRSSSSGILRALAVALAVALLLFVGGLLLLEPYWVTSADGVRLYLPWREETKSQEPEAPPLSSGPIVIVTPAPVVQEPLHAVYLPLSAFTDGTAQAQIDAQGGNAALFDMKPDRGLLSFVSAQEIAAANGVNPEDEGRNAAIRSLNAQEGLYTVARISCFRDDALPKLRPDLGVRSPVGNWRDGGGSRWLNASCADARQYITALCLELAGLGFDEILLDHAAYPISGSLDYIVQNDAYDPAQLSTTVEAFYTDLSAALRASYPGVKLSVVADPAVLAPSEAAPSGQSLSIASLMDRVWLRDLGEEREACAQLLEENGLKDPETALVSLSPAAGPEGLSWAVGNI